MVGVACHAWERGESLILKILLGDPELAIPLVNYIEATQRLKNRGEYDTTRSGTTTRRATNR
jgi:hypothetical protein